MACKTLNTKPKGKPVIVEVAMGGKLKLFSMRNTQFYE